MNLSAIVDRLVERIPWASQIGSAADFSVAIARAQFTESLYVIDLGERARPNSLVRAHRQLVDVTFGVIHFAQCKNDVTGGQAMATLDAYRADVVAAIAGWVPLTDYEPCQFESGRLIRFIPHGVVWESRFSTSYQLSNVT